MNRIYFLGSLLLLSLQAFAQCPTGPQSFYTQKNIDDFLVNYPSCTGLPASLTIEGTGSNITNLNGFVNLTSIAGHVKIFETGITNLSGLSGVTSMGGLEIDSNPNLTSLDGLESLTNAGPIISITLNSTLEDISALAGLTTMSSDLVIADNDQLTNCAILSICNNLSGFPIGAFSGNGEGCSDKSEVQFACEAILPVTLKDFKVKKESSTSQLTWVTTSEVNSSRFIVEHSQTGKTWRTVGTVASKGAGDYSFTDKEPQGGNNYYRLKMVDLDGTYAYSKIRSIRFDFEAAPYPNPVSDRILIKDVDWNSVKQVQFYNSNGIIVLESKKISSTGIDVSRISSGIYTAHLTYNNGSAKSFKIIKE